MKKTIEKVTPEYVKKGAHTFLKGSDTIVIGDVTAYAHQASMRIIAFKGKGHDQILNASCPNKRSFEAELKKLKSLYGPKPVTPDGHTLFVGTILVAQSDVKNFAKNTVEFYQVTDIVDGGNVSLRQIASDKHRMNGHYRVIPLPGEFVGAKFNSVVLANSVDVRDGLFASKADFKELELGADVSIKVYQSYACQINS